LAGRIIGDDLTEVVVESDVVGRRGDRRKVAVANRRFDAVYVDHVGRVPATVERVEPPAVRVPVGAHGGGNIGRVVGLRLARAQVQDGSNTARQRHSRAERLGREAVTEQQVVRCGDREAQILDAGRHGALEMTNPRRAQRLVQGEPVGDTVAETCADNGRELRECVRGLARRPTAAVLQSLREVPVIKRAERRDAGLEQLIDEPVIEGEPGRVQPPGALR
jgi:hypothetical protein